MDIHKRRSISESSSSSLSSIQSSNSETGNLVNMSVNYHNSNDDIVVDDADVLGYGGGGVSDDDHLSITSGASNASDGGVTITTWRHLNIAEPKQ